MTSVTLGEDRLRQAAGLAGAALALLALLAALATPSLRPGAVLRDFDAFYCAGASIDRGADPYLAEPLGTCERAPRPAAFAQGTPWLAVPAPLPPYALAPFALLARLPYLWAGGIWSLFLLLCTGVTVLAMRRLTALPLPGLIAAFALGGTYAALALGQVAPVATAGIALAALFLSQGRDRMAALAATAAMIEPHVGLPLGLALFLWRPRTRLTLLAAGAACCALSLALVRVPVALEYVRAVLPAHALSEVANEKQLSLTYLLHQAGAGDALALHAGELWYAAMLAIGLLVAGAVRKRSPALLAALPAAFTLLGGAFVHVVQIAAALPAALLLLGCARGTTRNALLFALLALAIPWVQFASLGTLFCLLAPIAGGVLFASFAGARPSLIATGVLAPLGVLSALWALVGTPAPSAVAALHAAYDPHALAEASWTLYVKTVAATDVGAFDLAKLPTWFGLALIVAIACSVALRPVKKSVSDVATASLREGSAASRRIATR
ncbi:MAG: glycosyltransferase 87 family protein [Vulcanimicrobiaceae bacterium]